MQTSQTVKERYASLGRAVAALRAGNPVAIPTETVYGLAGDATNGEAVARIFQIKGRPSFNPLICHVDGLVMASEFGLMSDLATRLASHFWPGPLTIVVPTRPNSGLSDLVTAGLGTVGLRCPKGLAREIISAFGRPVAAPSANRSGRISPTTADHVAMEYKGEYNGEYEGIELAIVDGGACEVGLESTIIKVIDDEITLLRPGLVTAEEIEAVSGIIPGHADKAHGIQAPGMMTSHYAPDARVKLNCESCCDGAAWLGFGNRASPENAGAALNLSPTSNLVEAAANLYSFLKELDTSGADCICVSPIPGEGLGIAINDRLARAAAPRTLPIQERAE